MNSTSISLERCRTERQLDELETVELAGLDRTHGSALLEHRDAVDLVAGRVEDEDVVAAFECQHGSPFALLAT